MKLWILGSLVISVGSAFAADSALPDITGMPQEPLGASAPSTLLEISNAPGADEAGCKEKVPQTLRAMVFKHFLNFQEMSNAQNRYFPPKAAEKAAHLLGMIPKESSGDSTNVTDMNSKEFGTYRAMTSLDRWNRMLNQKIVYNKQTNYGLAQQSMDRLVSCFKVKSAMDDFLKVPDEACSGEIVRKALAVYQGFARGRLTQDDVPLTDKEMRDPNPSDEIKKRKKAGLRAALWHCGTRFLFEEGTKGDVGQRQLEDAMDSIATCDTGTMKPNMASDEQSRCFARWVTLCPALNVDIAMTSPDSYYQTRKAPPLCEATFRKLIKPSPKPALAIPADAPPGRK